MAVGARALGKKVMTAQKPTIVNGWPVMPPPALLIVTGSNMEYEGYEISSAAEQLSESGEWRLRVSIVRHRDSQGVTNQQFFSTDNTFASQEEADIQSIEFGKKIIKGEVVECSVIDL